MAGALMYHEVERTGRPLARSDPGYLRYVVGETRFAEQLAWLRSAGLRGVALGDAHARRFASPRGVVITFDDGCESDWVVAAPHLLDAGFGATFYVVSGWIGGRGFLSAPQLRELAAAGFEVGSHSASHPFLTEVDAETLRRELTGSKRALEDIIGRPVTHLSCPGGRTSRAVARAAREAGYETMATSRIGANTASTDSFAIARCAVHRDTPDGTFAAFCRGEGLAAAQLRGRALAVAKAVLGTRLYVSLRDAALKSRFVGL
jgi:peptidoglycan/xylan/chitin deacetylase (PgdA/CDA1 family)